VEERSGVRGGVIPPDEEARLAFSGAIGTLAAPPGARDAVAVGRRRRGLDRARVRHGHRRRGWLRSFAIGSGVLTERHVRGSCPAPAELEALRAEAGRAFAGLQPPAAGVAYAVGGSATSLGRLTGGRLHPASLARALEELCSGPVEVVAPRLGLHPDRVRMLPAGIVVLAEAARALGVPLRVASGGLREGVILAMAAGNLR
jgi:exopolyphosphatase/guanosine-5'-triphosphate,3'-diphosphate pyrophosphatase